MSLLDLPNELLLQVVQDLGPNDIAHLASAHKSTDLTPLLKQPLLTALTTHQEPTSLFWASKHGHNEWVRIFLDNGAQVNEEDINGSTALHFAAICNRRGVIRELLKNGANIEKVDSGGGTALLAAVSFGHVDTVRFLLKEGANVEVIYTDGANALVTAASSKHCGNAMIKLLLDNGLDINTQAPGPEFFPGPTALQEAVFSGSRTKTVFLLQEGANPNLTNGHGTALHIVVDCIVRLQNVTPEAAKGENPASTENYISILTLLLEHGAKPQVTRLDGRTPLHIVAENGLNIVATILLKAAKHGDELASEEPMKNSLVNIQDMQGITALHFACHNQNLVTVKILVDNGADYDLRSCHGQSAHSLALQSKNYSILEIIRRARERNVSKLERVVRRLLVGVFVAMVLMGTSIRRVEPG